MSVDALPNAVANDVSEKFGAVRRVAFPLDSGYIDRRALLQIYPLLVHLRHFGEEYGASVDRVFARYGA